MTSPLFENKYLIPQSPVKNIFTRFRNFKDLSILPVVHLRVSYDTYESTDRVCIRNKPPRVRSLWDGHWFLLYDVDENQSSNDCPVYRKVFLLKPGSVYILPRIELLVDKI
jgi:hypothetical protein